MRATIAAVVLAATPAWADGPVPTQVIPISLKAGLDYAIEVHGTNAGSIDLVRPNGSVAAHLPAQDSPDGGAEFRADVGGTWTVRLFGDGTAARVERDCRHGPATQCPLTRRSRPGRSFAWCLDDDWYSVVMHVGQTYTFTYHSDVVDGELRLAGRNGRPLALALAGRDTTIVYRAPQDGVVYLSAQDADGEVGGAYTIAMH